MAKSRSLSTRTAMNNPAIYRLRAMEILKYRIHGESIAKLAERFDCHEDTIHRSLKWAMREGLVEDYENKVIGELVPKALTVYLDKLTETESGEFKDDAFFAAKDVLDKLFKLGDRFQVKETAEKDAGLRQYLAEKKMDATAAAAAAAPRFVKGQVIDVSARPAAIPAATIPMATQPVVGKPQQAAGEPPIVAFPTSPVADDHGEDGEIGVFPAE